MNHIITLVVCIIAISIIVFAIIRLLLKIKYNKLLIQINDLQAFSSINGTVYSPIKTSNLKEDIYIDIPTDLNNVFKDKVILQSEEEEYIYHYEPYYQEASSLIKKLEAFNITQTETLNKFIKDFCDINKYVKHHNDEIITQLLDTHKIFFDNCLKYPLDKQQRLSIISEEENCLVVSSAGSGKTSSIIGKVKYLTEIKGISPERILLISYTNKAAAELTERIATKGLNGYTFHKLAIDIIGRTTGIKPSICDNSDLLFVDIYHKLLYNSSFKESVVEYFVDYQLDDIDCEELTDERRLQLSEEKKSRLKAILPDMDGRPIYVRSKQRLCQNRRSLFFS